MFLLSMVVICWRVFDYLFECFCLLVCMFLLSMVREGLDVCIQAVVASCVFERKRGGKYLLFQPSATCLQSNPTCERVCILE